MALRPPTAMFDMLKNQFPHLDLDILNPELTFSENLEVPSGLTQTIIGQLGLPQPLHVSQEINNMKNAVDNQELKIQKSLVNEEDILGNIANRNVVRHNLAFKKCSITTMDSEEDSIEE